MIEFDPRRHVGSAKTVHDGLRFTTGGPECIGPCHWATDVRVTRNWRSRHQIQQVAADRHSRRLRPTGSLRALPAALRPIPLARRRRDDQSVGAPACRSPSARRTGRNAAPRRFDHSTVECAVQRAQTKINTPTIMTLPSMDDWALIRSARVIANSSLTAILKLWVCNWQRGVTLELPRAAHSAGLTASTGLRHSSSSRWETLPNSSLPTGLRCRIPITKSSASGRSIISRSASAA